MLIDFLGIEERAHYRVPHVSVKKLVRYLEKREDVEVRRDLSPVWIRGREYRQFQGHTITHRRTREETSFRHREGGPLHFTVKYDGKLREVFEEYRAETSPQNKKKIVFYMALSLMDDEHLAKIIRTFGNK